MGYQNYLSNFPDEKPSGKISADWLEIGQDESMVASSFSKKIDPNTNYITGEASANTWFAANPKIVQYFLPDTKLIMMVRNPTKRFLSHFKMYERFHNEGRKGYDFGSVETYIEQEIKLFNQGKKTRILHQGVYSNYLPQWEQTFGKQNIKIFKTNGLNEVESGVNILNEITDYLSLENFEFQDILKTKFNKAPKSILNTKAEELLDDFYGSYNQEFLEWYGIDLADA